MKETKRKYLIILTLLCVSMCVNAQNWDYITSSGEYYYGEAMASTEGEADKEALSHLCSMIAVHVSSDFNEIYESKNEGNAMTHNEHVAQCIQTYTTSTLTNCERMTLGKEPAVTVRRWMKRSELADVYAMRIEKAKDMAYMAKEALDGNKIGMALQYYYWAYSLIRSLQHPGEVKDDDGHVLVNWIPTQMRYILSDIKVSVAASDGENVDLNFSYKGNSVAEIEFNYNDGRETCTGKAKDGKGTMQMIPGYDGNVYHIDIEYEYRGLSRGDAEMESVLNVVGRKPLPEAAITLSAAEKKREARVSDAHIPPKQAATTVTARQKITPEKTMENVINAIRGKRHTDAYRYFTLDGREMFDKLIGYGKGRIIGTPQITYHKTNNGRTVARGLQMGFSFRNGTKTTFVEDVVFSFNQNGKIDNVAFGLGHDAEGDILQKKVAWREDMREQLVEFLENYKTAYCLKRLDYIKDIFADDAVIIIGNVTRTYTRQSGDNGKMTLKGKNIITMNRYTKDTYIEHLAQCFRKNEFINVRFTHSDIQKLEKENNKDIVCVQLAQDYNSSSYADKGYLFLMIDMADVNAPYIKVRTWQPEPDPKFGYYNAGDFYDD